MAVDMGKLTSYVQSCVTSKVEDATGAQNIHCKSFIFILTLDNSYDIIPPEVDDDLTEPHH